MVLISTQGRQIYIQSEIRLTVPFHSARYTSPYDPAKSHQCYYIEHPILMKILHSLKQEKIN